MKLKNLSGVVLLLLLTVFFSGTVMAEEDAKKGFSGSVSVLLADKYHGSGSGFDLSGGKAVIQPDLNLIYTFASGYWLGGEIWDSGQMDGQFRDATGAEIDYILSAGKDWGNFSLSGGIARFDCQKLFDGSNGDINEIFAEVDYTILSDDDSSLKIFGRIEWNQLIGEGSASSNIFLGAKHSMSFFRYFSLNSKAAAVFDDGHGSEAGAIVLLQSGISYEIVKDTLSWDITTIKFTTQLIGAEDRDTLWSASSALTYRF
ncbi:MAG: hypothetical protein WC682_02620 [Parcubacteria group bacterium]|jgi:hypothetical protein